jgi:hypothetical protein
VSATEWQAALWIPFVLAGGALSTYTLLHYVLDVLAIRYDLEVTLFQRAVAYQRVRAELSRVLGWNVFLMMGLAAIGWTFHPALWSGAFFATMFFWFYAAVKAFQMRQKFGTNGSTGEKEKTAAEEGGA